MRLDLINTAFIKGRGWLRRDVGIPCCHEKTERGEPHRRKPMGTTTPVLINSGRKSQEASQRGVGVKG